MYGHSRKATTAVEAIRLFDALPSNRTREERIEDTILVLVAVIDAIYDHDSGFDSVHMKTNDSKFEYEINVRKSERTKIELRQVYDDELTRKMYGFSALGAEAFRPVKQVINPCASDDMGKYGAERSASPSSYLNPEQPPECVKVVDTKPDSVRQ